jgi:glycosyltransferase involved in cell wall biosynthesis
VAIKSVHLTNYYHKDSGGISTAYNKLLEAAARCQRFVRLIVPGEISTVEEVNDYARIYYIKASFSPVFDKRYRLMLPWKTYIFDQSPIKKILREEEPDIIEIGEKYTLSLMAGLLRKGIMKVSQKRPMLVHVSCERMDDNFSSFISDGSIGKWFCRRFMGNYNLPMFDFHLTNSKYTGQELIDSVSPEKNPHRSERFMNFCWRFLRAPQVALTDRIFVNQCGVDVETFDAKRKHPDLRQKLIREQGLPEDATILLYAGRISPEKNFRILPRLMERLKNDRRSNYRLLVAGAGPSADLLASESEKRAPGRVTLLGQINDKSQLANLFANCDAFVHPNPREPFGITPLEAMASGLPVVAPNSGGVLSYATNDNAWLADPDAASFAEAIQDVFSCADTRRNRIQNGLETASRYSWEASTDSIFALYDRMHAEFTGRRDLYDYTEAVNRTDFVSRFATC